MNSRHGHAMRFGVLGPVEVLKGGSSLDLGPRQRRLVLVRLLIEDGRPVSQHTLCRDLWPTDRPTGAASSVRAHISRLRAVLDPVRQGRSALLVSGPAGYALKVPREARDTTLFEESVAKAREALRGRQLPAARQEIDAALGLWRGEALAEAAEHAFAIRERTRLDGALQDARELQTAILVQQGETEPAIGVAEGLVLKAPLRETSWALLMRALYAAGRPVEALRQYERFRHMLATELGLDPSPQLRDLHTAILRHDVGVLGMPPTSPTASPGTSLSPGLPAGLPAGLPPGPPPGPPSGPPSDLSSGPDLAAAGVHPDPGPAPATPFVGRDEQTAQLVGLLSAAAAGRPQWAVVNGEQGYGKTRLVEEVSARAAAAGFTVARTKGGQALSGNRGVFQTCPTVQLLDALRQDGTDSAQDEVAQKDPLGTVVHELTQAPTLCVVDDLDQAPQGFHRLLRRLANVVREAPVVFVCTLRNPDAPVSSMLLADLALLGATWLTLEPLTADGVAELLKAHGEEAGPEEAAALHRRAEGHPFALAELLKLPPGRRAGPRAQVPAAVRNILHARLVELPDAARTMLTYAAADGEWLDVGLLADVQGLAPDELLPLIDAAVTARILVWDADPAAGGTGRYRLPELPRDVVLSTQTPSSRQLRHAALARELAGRDDADPARLARHLRAAGPMAPAAAPAPSRPSALGQGH
ncbi:BTAD domain-containing putative transcriptional regulator [Streptomyces sp. AS02]|uniref:BTAD domain-containing putative transcriptional regulator n=1 Tax=Streptomyces sp. AS02 TaxID=2938946 RepID=UPI002022130B|nr:BTAD domain-containing putative transcriptional regulator [Streptomyces sp. AS02]MCL8010886.1 AAA family ATPase [Streptomyces sp. AS02]